MRRITAIIKRLVQKLTLQIKNFTRKIWNYSSYKETIGEIAENKIITQFKIEKSFTQITTDTSEFMYLEEDKTGNYQVKNLPQGLGWMNTRASNISNSSVATTFGSSY